MTCIDKKSSIFKLKALKNTLSQDKQRPFVFLNDSAKINQFQNVLINDIDANVETVEWERLDLTNKHTTSSLQVHHYITRQKLHNYMNQTYGRQAFSVAGPRVWNSLPDFIRDPTVSADCFRRLLKTYLFVRY